jgi:hypothetical protein
MLAVDSGGGVEIEEAYFDTRALPGGLKCAAASSCPASAI